MSWIKWKKFNLDYSFAELPKTYMIRFRDEEVTSEMMKNYYYQSRSDISDNVPEHEMFERFVLLEQQKRNGWPFVVMENKWNGSMGQYELYVHKLGQAANTYELHSYYTMPKVRFGDVLYELPPKEYITTDAPKVDANK